ncbi:rab3 GTPase-activating protein catalytic subunit [Toxorhynchites rutilus septentrionalis]|uniref:rab3 GTPase-activating protein catalytic subunit n=1 Tax=Toxorhynchites rutilus septentrionalis TaxID=329112 RepID=UPI0024783EFE|nr:rab3 GTPase-activating protein catalytic subunit [Toxorhynchites rutilus septentrionalis]
MLNEEVDDTEFFQQDFTTASEWELFNARLEEIFHEWNLCYRRLDRYAELERNQLSVCEWSIAKERIKFADVELDVVHYKAIIPEDGVELTEQKEVCQAFFDLLSYNNDYCIVDPKVEGKMHPLAQWYGLREFVVLVPVKNSITNESQIRILMSSIHIAVAGSSCDVPVFVHVLDRVQNVFLGVCEAGSYRLSFDIVHLNITPPTCKFLSGLISLFKGKVDFSYRDHAIVSIRFSYSLTKFLNHSYVVSKNIPFSDNGNEESSTKVGLPFGVAVDPISELVLHCTWYQLADNVVFDTQTHSALNPLHAHAWSLRARFEETPVCYLSECIQEFLQISDSRRAITEYFPELAYGNSQNIEGTKALERLTESKIPSLSSVIPGISSGGTNKVELKLDGSLNDDILRDMLHYMFPDADPDSVHVYNLPEPGQSEFDPLKIKSAHQDSLVHRLAMLLGVCNSYYGGKRAVAQLWAEFAQEMRYRVERGIQIPGVAPGFPDSRTCLLHQKLQMLNICMERRRIREGGLPFSMTAREGREGSHESEDEFYDCSDEDEEENKKRHAPWNQPVGRLSKLGKMLLVDSDEPLYIPITQEPVPKTEDQLEDDAEVMLKLGPGSELCTQMMSASLLSDMESFRAANPAGKLEDFIRWYSPRDWIEEDTDERDPFGRKGHLSSRMMIPGNTWQTVWENARAVPARRQKRLFDDTREAEKVLHYFESRTIGQIAQLTMSSMFHTAIKTLSDEAGDDAEIIPQFAESVEKIITTCCKLSRENWIADAPTARGNSMKKYENLISDITQLENVIIQVRSLRKKLSSVDDDEDNVEADREAERALLSNLLKGFESELQSGSESAIGKRVLNMFTEAKKAANEQANEQTVALSLPDPVEKQYILRLIGSTASNAKGPVQFMRAILSQNEFRLCGAFNENTTFY